MILHVLAVNDTDYHTYCTNPNVEFEIWQLRKEGNYELNMGLFVTQNYYTTLEFMVFIQSLK